MHQRQPISIDKGRPFCGKNGPVQSSRQVSFHKIYRQKRCYSLFDKEQEGHGGGSQRKVGLVNSQRDSDDGLRSTYSSGFSSDGGLRGNYSSGFSSCKSTQRIDHRQGNHSTSNYAGNPPNRDGANGYRNHSTSSYAGNPPNRDGANGYRRQYLKRQNDGFGCNLVSRPEFDEPFVKKRKVDSHRFSAVQHGVPPEAGRDEQKTVLDDTKWMYKNQHAKMSGPYGARQLIEGFHSGFLNDDLPVHQLLEGKLCKPVMLKELVDDLESYSSPMHNPKRCSNQPFSEDSFCKFTPSVTPCKSIKDEDLPPGFGARSTGHPHPERPNSYIWPNTCSSVAGVQCSVGAFSPSEDENFDLPPGFESIDGRASSIDPQPREPFGSWRRFSTGAGIGLRGKGGQGMELCYDKLEPVVHSQGHSKYQGSLPHAPLSFTRPGTHGSIDKSHQLEAHTRDHVSHQHSSPPSIVSFTMQRARNPKDESLTSETTWGFTSPNNTGLSNLEPQVFSSPTVCIGLPVSKPAMSDLPVPNCLAVSCGQAAQADKELPPKELRRSSAKHDVGLDPLLVVHLELLAGVQRSYMRTVWSALVDEELKYWISGKSTRAKLRVTDDSSRSREASSSLSSAEFGISTLESNALQTDASVKNSEILLDERAAGWSDHSCLNAHVESAETSLEIRAAQCEDGSGLSTQSASLFEHHGSSSEAVSPRKDVNAHTSHAITDARLSCNRDLDRIEASLPLCVGEIAELHQRSKADSLLSMDENSNLSPKLHSILTTSVSNSEGGFVDHTEERQQWSGGLILQEDCTALGRNETSGKTSDVSFLETEPAFLVYGRKKRNMKSLRQLMKITSKLRPRQPMLSSSKDRIDEVSGETARPETSEANLEVTLPIVEGYNGCARTSVDRWLQRKVERHAPHAKSLEVRDSRLVCLQRKGQGVRTRGARKCPSAVKSTRSQAKLQLARSRIHGWGVFAAEAVELGDFVIEYVGEVIRPRIADIRERRYNCLGIGTSFLLRVDDETVVDATKRGGLARFMNYSCDPNCASKIISVNGAKKVYIYAKRLITVGEELTYDCKFQLEDQKIPCTCGSTRCRGFLI